MQLGLATIIGSWLTHWLTKEPSDETGNAYLYDFERLSYELRPGDVILVEGRSRVSNVIKLISQSPWTHSALYIGRPYELEPGLRAVLCEHYDGPPDEQLIVEALLGEGTVVYTLSKYRHDHLRICRPKGLTPADAKRVIGFAVRKLGVAYDVRQLLDLARFIFPYAVVPRRWRSSLFVHNAGAQARTVCSTMLAEAFNSIDFPVMPFVDKERDGFRLYKRNPRLLTPKDFDYSPYFDIIKYPFFGLDDLTVYRQLPWNTTHLYCNDLDDCLPHAAAVPVEAADAPPATGAEARVPDDELGGGTLIEDEQEKATAPPAQQLVNLLDAVLPVLARRASREDQRGP